MSEQRKEPLVVSSSLLIFDKKARLIANLVPSLPGVSLSIEEAVQMTKDLVASYNACLSMSNPEADVKAIVEALHLCFRQYEFRQAELINLFRGDIGLAIKAKIKDAITRL